RIPFPEWLVGWAGVDRPTVQLRLVLVVAFTGLRERRAPLAGRLFDLVPSLGIGIPRLVAELPTPGTAEILSQHRRDREHPVHERPAVVSAAEDHPRRDAPLPRRPDLDGDMVPPWAGEELGEKGACTAGAVEVISRYRSTSSSSAASPHRSRIVSRRRHPNPSSPSESWRPSDRKSVV